MSYLEQEKAFDRAVIFLSQAVAKEEELPVACVLHSIRDGYGRYNNNELE